MKDYKDIIKKTNDTAISRLRRVVQVMQYISFVVCILFFITAIVTNSPHMLRDALIVALVNIICFVANRL